MRDLNDVFDQLQRSAFRQRFKLMPADLRYISDKGMPTVLAHAQDFVAQRLAPAAPKNDGKQTPLRGHPAFIAQHATATCCRSCLSKWHRIPLKRELTTAEQRHIVEAIACWLRMQDVDVRGNGDPALPELPLFRRL
ncbi:DUF4186 domain-containing protein [Methylobacterium sp. 17Sr1-1]|uniref:DUF4186 domain-containing protein n=1 Tax=Methylobacterium sp. 17Sr1-1 TaxID=2202826 RepID=UPI000D6ED38B|nr:DUF4186 domain-containing protein [Methylobacterium sp. 17Sr1-1]AWN51047.1 DUF4186 domain-containing protein [Methylobacterium sp. 17Sr1-1]